MTRQTHHRDASSRSVLSWGVHSPSQRRQAMFQRTRGAEWIGTRDPTLSTLVQTPQAPLLIDTGEKSSLLYLCSTVSSRSSTIKAGTSTTPPVPPAPGVVPSASPAAPSLPSVSSRAVGLPTSTKNRRYYICACCMSVLVPVLRTAWLYPVDNRESSTIYGCTW